MLCDRFHVTPRQLEDEFSPDEVADFSVILDYITKIEARERRKVETQGR